MLLKFGNHHHRHHLTFASSPNFHLTSQSSAVCFHVHLCVTPSSGTKRFQQRIVPTAAPEQNKNTQLIHLQSVKCLLSINTAFFISTSQLRVERRRPVQYNCVESFFDGNLTGQQHSAT